MKLEPGAKVTPNIELVRPLGAGGMGSVWIAHHLTLKTDVAVKFVATDKVERDKLRQRFSKEASLAAQVKHPHVVQMFDHGETEEGTPYIVMELLLGESLAERLAARHRLTTEEVSLLVRQVSKVLERAHDLHIVHRDLKPANLYLVDSGFELFVKVLDFGIAKRVVGDDDMKLTDSSAVVGTPHYMSPEAIVGTGELDGRADLWSLAVIVYEALTGRLPFEGNTFAEQTLLVHEGTFLAASSLVEDLPEALDDWFRRALAPDVEDRFGDAKELARAYALAMGEQPPTESARVVVGLEGVDDHEQAATVTGGGETIVDPASADGATGQTPATLDGTSETVPLQPRRAWAAAAVGLFAVAGLVLATRAGGPRPAASASASASVVAPPTASSVPTSAPAASSAPVAASADSATVTVVVDSMPPRVEVLKSGEVLGRAPGPIALAPEPIELTFRAPGYRPTTREVTPAEGEPIVVTLQPIPEAPRPKPGLGDKYDW